MNCTECLNECLKYVGCIEGIMQRQINELIVIFGGPLCIGLICGFLYGNYRHHNKDKALKSESEGLNE